MVKRGAILERELAQGSDGPYAEQPIAKRAPGSRRRVVALLLVGALLLAIEVAADAAAWNVLALAGVLSGALLVHRERLAGLVLAAFAAVLAVLVPLAMLQVVEADAAYVLRALVSAAFGLALLPDLLVLARDAELQHAYGLWATRGT